jgi:DnaJ-class molecular chaperone
VSQADELAAGLKALGPDYNAVLCEVCKGMGRYEQTYTAGCGMGSYQTMGPCTWCNKTGLTQGKNAASDSVVNQVLQASKGQP